MQKDSENRFPVRKSPRLPNYDYSARNYFFVTICTSDKRKLFGPPGRPNRQGLLAERGLKEISMHFPNVSVDKYVIMPNHIHVILVNNQPGTPLSVVVGLYKSYVTREIRRTQQEIKVWQRSFHDHVIRNQQDYERIWNYIEGNPLKWEEDCFYIEE